MPLNAELADVFALMANLIEIKGENSFKAIAFSKLSRLLKDSPMDLRRACDEGTLQEIEGIGKSSQRIIEEYIHIGHSTDLDTLAASVPSGLVPLLEVEGLGPKTISVLWRQRGITSADELAKALAEGRLAGIKGIGEKKIEMMRRGLEARAKRAGRLGIGEALPVAQDLVAQLRALPQVSAAEIAGSLRRRCETIGDIDLLGAVKDSATGEEVTAAFAKFPVVERVLVQGVTKASIVTAGGLQVDLRIVPEQHFGAALLYFTGSKEHNVKVRELARKKEMTLNEWGLYKLSEYDRAEKQLAQAPPVRAVASLTEQDIYAKLGLPYIEPELREDRGEIDAALAGKLPILITRADIRGELHSHTTASDGVASIEEMAQAAAAMGYEYLAITDHSQSQAIANGLDPKRLLKHAAEIRRISEKLKGITLLAGSEVDILADGKLDYEDAVLAELDFVIASPHFSLRQDERKATDRLLRAIENRYVNVIGHPTGRLINRREGLPLDLPAVFRAAAQSGTALEINAGYPRLDLNDANSRFAIENGAMLSINTDAHSAGELPGIELGIGVARRAWAQKKDVLNCMSVAEMKRFVAKKR